MCVCVRICALTQMFTHVQIWKETGRERETEKESFLCRFERKEMKRIMEKKRNRDREWRENSFSLAH